jgi:hypothetical protein
VLDKDWLGKIALDKKNQILRITIKVDHSNLHSVRNIPLKNPPKVKKEYRSRHLNSIYSMSDMIMGSNGISEEPKPVTANAGAVVARSQDRV